MIIRKVSHRRYGGKGRKKGEGRGREGGGKGGRGGRGFIESTEKEESKMIQVTASTAKL